MNNYFEIQKKAFIQSFKIDNKWFAYFLELFKFIFLFALMTLSVVLWLKFFSSMEPLFNIIEQIHLTDTVITEQMADQVIANKIIVDYFVMKSYVLIALTALITIISAALFDYCIFLRLKKQKFIKKEFFRILWIYFVYILFYGCLGWIFFDRLPSVEAIAVFLSILFVLCLYTLFIYQATLSYKESFWNFFKKGFLNCWKIQHVWLHFIVVIIFSLLLFWSTFLIFSFLGDYFVFFEILILLFFIVWIKNYILSIFKGILS